MNALGINQGTSGNVSVRFRKGFLITPSGVDYDLLGPGDIVAMDFDGEWRCFTRGRRPSSEWRFHRDILQSRAEIGAVVHTHAIHATALSCLGREIPPFHYMVALAGGDSIRCAPYATFGSQELSDNALEALRDRTACLIANHGMIACGADPARALALAVEVETLAAHFWRALQIGEPHLLSAEEMARVRDKILGGAGYGSV
jgi:L-fuculose-phosphate aldolase